MQPTFELTLKKYKRYLQSIANNLHYPEHFDDLVSIGMVELYQCYLNYDPTKSTQSFSMYFPIRCRNKMLDYLRDNSRLIRLPAHIVQEVLNNTFTPITLISTNTTINENGDILADNLPSEPDIPKKDFSALYEAIDSLKDEHKIILNMRYDLDDISKPKTLREIGSELGLTPEGIRKSLVTITNKLKDKLKDEK